MRTSTDFEESESSAPPGLAKGTMSGLEILAQSVAGIAPSAVMATGPALVALGAGSSVMYSYLASTLILVMVGWCISQFAKREGDGGTLLSYITKAFGPGAGFIGSIGLAFGYLLIAIACLAGIGLYAAPLLTAIGIPGAGGMFVTIVLEVVVVVLAAYAMIRGVQLSTRIGLVLEIISVTAILVVVVAVLGKNGLSSAPFHPSDFGVSGIVGGMVLAILGYVGFESAANMGAEAQNATRAIPRAVVGSALIAGSLYLISAYAQLTGFGDPTKLSAAPAPLNTLADLAGVHVLGYLIDIGAVASFFACVTGSLNAASRLIYSMGQDRLLHRSAGNAHPTHQTPHFAINGLSAIAGLVAVSMTLSGMTLTTVFAVTGTIGTYGYMVAYIMITIGVPIYLYRIRQPIAAAVVIGGLAALGMLFVLFKNLYPVPPAPYNLLPWIFLVVLVVFGAWYPVARIRRVKSIEAEPLPVADPV